MQSTTSKPSGFRKVVATCAAAALAVSLPLLGTAGAHATPSGDDADSKRAELLAASYEGGRYLVELRDDPIATYEGGVQTFAATADDNGVNFDSPQAKQYGAHLESVQAEVAAGASVSIDTSLTATYNGFVADLTAEQASQLAQDPNVVSMVENEILQLQQSPANEFLDLEGAFSQIGGWDGAGEGIVVGIIDSGIAPENPFFAGDALGSTPSDQPYLGGDGIVFNKADGGVFNGVCEEGQQFDAADCSTKIISAKYYVDGFGEQRVGVDEGLDYISPRDNSGHGSHTASTAAGNSDVPMTSGGGQDLGTMSGVAPAAKIAAYKVCWDGPDPAVTTDDGCATTDLVQAIEDATVDGVDVINFSIGGGAATSVYTAIDRAFLGASAAGVFVSVSAGNSGPGASTSDHASPWYTSVAAATVPNYEGTIVLADGTEFNGASATVPLDDPAGITGQFVYAGNIPAEGVGADRAALCVPDSLDAEAAAGKIVLCDRGENARAEKSQVVGEAGGIGSVLVNVDDNSLDLDDHAVPTVHVNVDVRDQLLAAAESGEEEITLKVAEERTAIAPQVAGFSSRGPMIAESSDIVKPDIAAPGVGIIAAGSNAEGDDPTFVFMSGTSMSSPHIAGLGAAYLSAYPQASPAEVKSVMMTTAYDTLNADGAPVSDAFTQGQGMVDPTKMFNAGFYFDATTEDYYQYLVGLGIDPQTEQAYDGIDPSDLNLPSIGIDSLVSEQTVTRTATAINPGTYTVDVQAPAGVEVTVEPSTLTFGAAGETQEFTVTLNSDNAELGTWLQGRLVWSNGEQSVRQQIVVNAASFAADSRITSTESAATEQLNISAGVPGELSVQETGLTPFLDTWDDVAPEGEVIEEVGDDTVVIWDEEGYYSETVVGDDIEAFVVDLSSEDAATDYDVTIGHFTPEQELTEIWEGLNAGSDERIEILDAQPGFYVVLITDWAGVWGHLNAKIAAVTPDSGAGDFQVALAEANSGNASGNASTDGFTEPVTPGQVTADVSWTGLEVGTEYFGVIEASLEGHSAITAVEVDVQEDTNPTDPVLDITKQPVAPETVEIGEEVAITAEFEADPAPAAHWQAKFAGSDEWVDITDPSLPNGGDSTDSTDSFGAEVSAMDSSTDDVTGYTSTLTFTVDETVVGAQFRLALTQDDGENFTYSDATAPLELAGDPTDPSDPSDPDPTAPDPTDDDGTGDDDLPETGASAALWLLVIAAGLGLVGAGAYATRLKRS